MRSLSKQPIIGNAFKLVKAFSAMREAGLISKHFAQFLEPVVANQTESIEEAFKIRHDVYCEELHFEPMREDKMETDEFDSYSRFCLIKHKPSQNYAGCVRIVTPSSDQELLPIEKYCSQSLQSSPVHPREFDRSNICEISRLAVRPQFRRRRADKFEGAASGVINEQTYSEAELRCFPFLTIGLYLSIASLAVRTNVDHAFVMMEPRLARSMSFLGIKFQQLGPAVEYHGLRAPYYMSSEMLLNSLPKSFTSLMKSIDGQIENGLLEACSYPRDDYLNRLYPNHTQENVSQKRIIVPNKELIRFPAKFT
ncbi:PEP-CTERM/exosortase system-associated acyltransferase [Alginatibacterium sediminis]|uniref:PEP-CTERM/exosortase system-associated acyltransferase n=2 Tax=Alginatibacterium sediminis TaxID=2164068 RepID=A0A420E820_9ALTE|nr:PEP-CTERM/exosortase system-associated acyltransferase [Alginatibacterium sediminis]